MSKNATPNDGSEQSFEPPYPPNTRGYARIDDLQPFHLEDETYVERDNADLVASIEDHGFREGERPTVCPDGTILLGHRRVDAADQLGMERVPVFVEDVEPDSHEARSIFVSSNQHRDKTPGERVNEAMILEEIEKERAEERQGSREDIRQNFAGGEKGRAREKAAQQVGFSRESYRKGKYVKDAAEDDDVAAAEWEDLMHGDQSIHGAYTVVKEMEEPDEPDEDTDSVDESTESTDTDGEEEGTDEMDYPDEIRQWTHSQKPTGAVYRAKADVEVYGLVQVVLEDTGDGWLVYVDGPGVTERIIVCNGEDYTSAFDSMMGYLDNTKPDEAREAIDTEETRPSPDSSGQQDTSSDGETTDDEQDTEDEEAADEAPGGEADFDETTAKAISRQEELEVEIENLRKRIDYLQEGSKRQAARIDEYRERALNAKMDAPDVDDVEKVKAHVDVAVSALPGTPLEQQPMTQQDINDRVSKASLQLEDAQAKLEDLV